MKPKTQLEWENCKKEFSKLPYKFGKNMFNNLKKAYLKKHPSDNNICKNCQEKDI